MRFEINEVERTISSDLIVAYSRIATASMGHRVDCDAMDPGIRMLVGNTIVAGPAVTVRTFGRDSTACHKVFDLIVPGDIIVIDREGDERYACWGEMMSLAAKLNGVAGVIVDGLVTDIAALRLVGLPVFARGLSPVTTLLKGEGGGINVPVRCGGVNVIPGALVVADEDGVQILEPQRARALLLEFEAQDRGDEEYRRGLMNGMLPSEMMPTGNPMRGKLSARS